MNKVQEFLNEQFGEIRCLKDDKNVLWFVASDVAKSLEYRDSNDMTRKLDDDEKDTQTLCTLGGNQKMTIINESGLYSAVLSISKKNIDRFEKAKKFKKWITSEVIPTIRETGAYVEEDREEEFIYKYFTGLSEETKQAMVVDLIKNNKKNKVKASKWDKFLSTDSTYTFTEVSKLISTKAEEDNLDIRISNKKLTEFLREQGILSKNKKGTSYLNTPNKDYEDYFNVISIDVQGKFNKCQTRVKASGVEFIYDLLVKQIA